jgi:hypothetical protein
MVENTDVTMALSDQHFIDTVAANIGWRHSKA